MPKQYLDSYADICMKSNRDFDAFYCQIDREIQARGNRQEALRDISIQVMSAVMQNDPDRAGVVEQYFRGYANIKDWQASRQSYHFCFQSPASLHCRYQHCRLCVGCQPVRHSFSPYPAHPCS